MGFIGAGGHPMSGSVKTGARACLTFAPPRSSATSRSLVSRTNIARARRAQSSAVNASALSHCMFSSPNHGIARTRSTDQVTRLPGRRARRGSRGPSLRLRARDPCPGPTRASGRRRAPRASRRRGTRGSRRTRGGRAGDALWTTPRLCPVCCRFVSSVCQRCTRVKSVYSAGDWPARSRVCTPVTVPSRVVVYAAVLPRASNRGRLCRRRLCA